MHSSESLSLYRSLLTEHATHIKEHYLGLDEDDPLPPSIFRPSSHWSSKEKHQFFLGLNRFSRLRPDLIADTVGSKTTAEVCEYLSLLARASHERGPAPKSRNNFPAAREVSDDWVSYESTLAGSSSTRDVILERSSIGRSRRIECTNAEMVPRNVRVGEVFRNIRRATRKGKRSIGDIMSPLEEDEGAEPGGDHGGPPFKLTKVEHTWVREDLLRDLDNDRLAVLDELLDDTEPAQAADKHGPATDGGSWERSRPAATEHLSDHGEFPASPLASLTSLERTRYRKRMYMRRKRAKDEAVARGEDTCNATGDESMSRLKVGRKKGKNIEVSPFPHPLMEHGGDEDEGKEKFSLRPRRSLKFQHIKSVLQCAGFTADDLVTDGLDLLYLSRLGNLAGMYSRSHVDPHDHVFLGTSMSFRPNKIGTSLPIPAIRYSTLQLLRAYIKSYLDLLISLCIVIATAEHQAKQRSKVWRGKPNTISAANVQKAIPMMKRKYLARTSFIRQLAPRLKLKLVVSKDIGGSISDFVDRLPDPIFPSESDLLQDISGTFLLLPLSLQRPGPDFEDEMEHFLRIDGPGFNTSESEIIPDQDDMPKLWDVLRREEELDARDRKLDVEYERELCAAFNKDFQEPEEESDEDNDDDDEVGIRDERIGASASGIFRPHGRGSKAFKSQEYITSSDEDSQVY